MLNHKNFNLFFIFLVFTLSLVSISAVPPFEITGDFDRGYAIKIPPQEFIKQNQDYTFHFHLFNITNGVPIGPEGGQKEDPACYFHLYNSAGHHMLETLTVYDEGSNVVNEWEQKVLGGNFTSTGTYSYIVQCNSTSHELGGYESVRIVVSGTGKSQGTNIFLVLIIAAILIFAASYSMDVDWGVFLSGILFILAGIYSMIYGIGIDSDLYTRGIAIISIGIGMVFVVASLFNISKGENMEEED